MFDPYHEWLGIPASEQPPHHYRLLGIPLFEDSPTVIENAADQRMAHLRTFQTGQHAALSQKLLNEVATAKVCLLNAAKKTAYDENLRQPLQPNSGPTPNPAADRPETTSLDLGFTAVPAKRRPIASKDRGKKSRPMPAAIIGAAVLTVAAAGFVVWLTIGHDSPPGDGETAKVAAPANSAKPPKQASSKFTQPSTKETRAVVSTEPKGESKADDPKAVSDPKPPEAKVQEETKTTPIADKAVEAKPTSNDSAADKAEPNDEPATTKKLVPPSADEQKRLMREVDEIYKPGGVKDQAGKATLARKLLDDGRKNEANRAEQFVLLRRAGEIARDAGEVDLMLEAVDAIAEAGFDIRPPQVKARILKQLLDPRSPRAVLRKFPPSARRA